MFHRRLLMLAAAVALVIGGLGLQLLKLSVVEGAQRLAEAEARLAERSYLPTYRGRILDRHGRILAQDRASYDVAVEYDVVTGAWVARQAAREARREVGLSRWNAMSPEQRQRAIDARRPHWQHRADLLWSEIARLGEIDPAELTRRRDAIRAVVQQAAASTWEQQRERWRQRFGIEDEDDDTFRPMPLREHRQAHVMLPRVQDAVAFEFQRMSASGREFDGMVQVIASHRREQPWSSAEVILQRDTLPKPLRSATPITIPVRGVADHIVGSVRDEIWAEDVQQRPFVHSRTGAIDLGGYRVGDSVGSRGLERSFEDHLRGLRGMVRERRDTGEQQRTEPVPGDDLRTTLDVALQARIQAILSHEYGLTRVQRWHNNDLPQGTPLNSAAVVIEVETGEILSMISMPTIAMGRDMNESQRRMHDPWVNRAVEAIYPPGSILKPLVLSAAVQEGAHSLGSTITCTGHYYSHLPTLARCWIFRERYGMTTHGPLRAEEAMARSCNIFFYTLADRLGMARLSMWLRRFGLGSPLDVGLMADGRGESAGHVPDADEVESLRREGRLAFDTVIMGIGQGPVTWTPLHAANAYAMVARGGSVRHATLVSSEFRVPSSEFVALNLSPPLVNAVLEGLRQSVEEPHGTGYRIIYEYDPALGSERIINAEGVTIWAKTGTAQAPAMRIDTDGEADHTITGLSHAWFVGLVGPRNGQPQYAIAVIVEYGGSGGRVAGPIANQIIRALQAEGYLPATNRNPPVTSRDREGAGSPGRGSHERLDREVGS